MKKEIPIIMSTPMVQALLTNRKTVTRRMSGLHEINENPDDYQFEWGDYSLKKPFRFTQKSTVNKQTLEDRSFNQAECKCPYGQPGDILYVKESHRLIYDLDEAVGAVRFKDGAKKFVPELPEDIGRLLKHEESKWRPSIHMPKNAARIWLRNKGVRPERIADITEQDCIAEGVGAGFQMNAGWPNYMDMNGNICNSTYDTAYDSFRSLWQSLHGVPSPIQTKVDGKLRTISYIVYPFDQEAAERWRRVNEYRKKPLIVIVNPWVWRLEFEILSTTGRPTSI